MWHVIKQIIPGVKQDHDAFALKRLEFSAALLWEPHVSQRITEPAVHL